jgi:hypothetical protein
MVIVNVSPFFGCTLRTYPYVPLTIVGTVFAEFDDANTNVVTEGFGTIERTLLVEDADIAVGVPPSMARSVPWTLVSNL